MNLLVLGLVVFLGLHCVPMFPNFRQGLIKRLGANGYRGLYSLLSAAGLVLIVMGYGEARVESVPVLYSPPAWTKHLMMLLMVPVFPLLIAAYVQGWIKRTVRHPMLVAVKIWAFSHLLVRGDLASVLMFGGFLVWAIADRISVKRRGGGEPSVGVKLSGGFGFGDVMVILAGLVAYGLFVWKGHELVIGVPLT